MSCFNLGFIWFIFVYGFLNNSLTVLLVLCLCVHSTFVFCLTFFCLVMSNTVTKYFGVVDLVKSIAVVATFFPGSLTSCDSFLNVFKSKGLKPEAICPCACSTEAATVSIRRYLFYSSLLFHLKESFAGRDYHKRHTNTEVGT